MPANNVAIIYARLSSEDSKTDMSLSIINQIALCKQYALEHNLIVEDIYIDDGYSGTNFNRPEFKRLIDNIEKKKVSTIIVKDLSRLGRNFIQTSYYIEDYFTKHRIRFISINDNYDSLNNEEEISLPIKNFMNGYYAKQSQKKIRAYYENYADKKSFAMEGCYGYMMVNKQLVIDETAAKNVRLIYQRYINEEKVSDILNYLNDNKIPCPGYYKDFYLKTNFNYTSIRKSEIWTRSQIHTILTNRQYIGDIVNRKILTDPITKKRYTNPNPTILENQHEAIIDKETFNRAQELLKKRFRPKTATDDLRLKKLIFSEDGRGYVYKHYIKNNREVQLYLLSDNSHVVKAEELHKLIYKDCFKVYKTLTSYSNEYIESYIKKAKAKSSSFNIDKILTDKLLLEKKLQTSFEKYVSGTISKEKYLEVINPIKEKINSLSSKINDYNLGEYILKQNVSNLKKFIKDLAENKEFKTKLDLIRMMVSKVTIIKDNRNYKIHITYKFEKTIK